MSDAAAPLVDEAARLRALTDFSSTLLVEAGAGVGKTSLMAGRIALMLAAGVPARGIAAITFTEVAASELLARVGRFVRQLLAGDVPRDLQAALPKGLSAEQRVSLERGAACLDEITCTTIHGFCQALIRPYAVEADIDPGARIADEGETELAFRTVFENWIKARLSGASAGDDAVACLVTMDPEEALALIRNLARFRLSHPTARPVPEDLAADAADELRTAVAAFARWHAAAPQDDETTQFIAEFEQLSAFYGGAFARPPGFPELWRLAHPPRIGAMKSEAFDFKLYRRKTAWKAIAKTRGLSAAEGERLNEEATLLYDAVKHAFTRLLGRVATALVARLSGELDELIAAFAAFKRSAAILDFDDLLLKARDLVRRHDSVRRALARRFQRILVDEFQDTDPVQCEILFTLAGEGDAAAPWWERALTPGALFLVGDPKQAIYRFRGADVASYMRARDAVRRAFPGNVLSVSANFRSHEAILGHVNRCFETVLSAPGQPGFSVLAASFSHAEHGFPCVARLDVNVEEDANAEQLRAAEAEAVANLCARLIGSIRVRVEGGRVETCRAGHIALLAPTGTGLWHYERALEERSIPVASQAGKGFFRRQEVQDLIALTRVLADGRDLVAFGALMRGPLVGLSEEELLDVVAGLPADLDRPDLPPRFTVATDPQLVAHPIAREALSVLQGLRRMASSATPFDVLAQAVEELRVRPVLAARYPGRGGRALANVDAFLERTTPYGVQGLRALARDLTEDWEDDAREVEGRPDAERDAVQIVTMHSAKGLEWPVVVPINTATQFRRRPGVVHRRSDDTFHVALWDTASPALAEALTGEEQEIGWERSRLWYVACTRAMDLLVLPKLSSTPNKCWINHIDLRLGDVPALDLSGLSPQPIRPSDELENAQTRAAFADEARRIAEAAPEVHWHRPSLHDLDRAADGLWQAPVDDGVAAAPGGRAEISGGALRGTVLHKLMEELLTGEISSDRSSLEARAGALIVEAGGMASADPQEGPNAAEMAAVVAAVLALPDLAPLWGRLVPEVSVFGSRRREDGSMEAVSGQADAVALDAAGWPEVVVDWKSDVAPSVSDRRLHATQIRDYVECLGASLGLIVYMTTGQIDRVVAGEMTAE